LVHLTVLGGNLKQTSFSAPLRVCLCGEDLDWLGFRCVAAAVQIRLSVSLADDGRAEFFDQQILDNIWELTAWPDCETRWARPPIKVSQDIPLASGLGSSSAASLATAHLYSLARSPKIKNERDNPSMWREAAVAAAYEAERRVTNGGGMDHVTIKDGGIILLQGTRKPVLPSVIARVATPGDLGLVIIDSRSTKVCGSHLAWVRSRDAEHNPEQARYCQVCDALASRAWSSVVTRDWMRLAAVVNSAHEAMRDLQHMSTPLLETLREAALSVGFPGVKITGSGSGGCLVAVTTRADVSAQVASLRRITRALTPVPAVIPVGIQSAAWEP
jgi:mevalonate kinase